MHRTPQNRRGCIIFWHSNALIQEVLAKKRILSWNSHWRLFILQSVTGQQGLAYRHIILLAFSEASEEVATQIAKNCRRWQPHSHLTPPWISPYTLYFQKLESLAYIFVADSMGLSSFKCVQWALKDASFLQQSAFGRSRSCKVIQGRWFGYQSKARMWHPISH